MGSKTRLENYFVIFFFFNVWHVVEMEMSTQLKWLFIIDSEGSS